MTNHTCINTGTRGDGLAPEPCKACAANPRVARAVMMIGRPCVACDEVSIGARDGFDLCCEHWTAVEAEDQTRAAETKRNARREAQARFRKAYPHIAITASETVAEPKR